MKIAFFDLAGWEIPLINKKCKELGLEVIKTATEPFDASCISQIKDVEILSVFLSKVDQSIMQALPNLKLISARATGLDHIDINFAQKNSIAVIYLPSYAEETVAEYAMALILMLSRRLGVTFAQSLNGIFDQKTTRGHDLAGKTLGIIGTGKIGCKLAKMANGFDMNIICYDISPKPEKLIGCALHYVSLEELLKSSDIISIHLPYTKETHHLIDFGTLKLLKKGVLFVNTARGAIANISAIRQGLKDGIFGGVAMDTFEGSDIWIHQEHILNKKEIPEAEELRQAIEAFSLLKFDNVILTPHNAYNSHEAIERMIETTFSDIAAFCKKK